MQTGWFEWVPSTGQDWSAAATTVGTLVALVGLAWSFVRAKKSDQLVLKGQETERQASESSAARAEAAAALSELYTRRVVDALERIANDGLGAAEQPTMGVRWSMVHDRGDTYRLENVGDLAAEHIHLSKHQSLPVFRAEEDFTLTPGEAKTFMAARVLGTSDSTIAVTWRQQGDAPEAAPHEWRYPLPPKPKA